MRIRVAVLVLLALVSTVASAEIVFGPEAPLNGERRGATAGIRSQLSADATFQGHLVAWVEEHGGSEVRVARVLADGTRGESFPVFTTQLGMVTISNLVNDGSDFLLVCNQNTSEGLTQLVFRIPGSGESWVEALGQPRIGKTLKLVWTGSAYVALSIRSADGFSGYVLEKWDRDGKVLASVAVAPVDVNNGQPRWFLQNGIVSLLRATDDAIEAAVIVAENGTLVAPVWQRMPIAVGGEWPMIVNAGAIGTGSFIAFRSGDVVTLQFFGADRQPATRTTVVDSTQPFSITWTGRNFLFSAWRLGKPYLVRTVSRDGVAGQWTELPGSIDGDALAVTPGPAGLLLSWMPKTGQWTQIAGTLLHSVPVRHRRDMLRPFLFTDGAPPDVTLDAASTAAGSLLVVSQQPALDGSEVRATLRIPGQPSQSIVVGKGTAPVVASDGSGWFVVWIALDETLVGRRIAHDGMLRDEAPFRVAAGPSVGGDVAFDGQQFIAVHRARLTSRIEAVRVLPNGMIVDTTPAIVYELPSLSTPFPDRIAVAATSAKVLVAWNHQLSIAAPVTAQLLSTSLERVGSKFTLSADGAGAPAVAAAGDGFLTAWIFANAMHAARVDAEGHASAAVALGAAQSTSIAISTAGAAAIVSSGKTLHLLDGAAAPQQIEVAADVAGPVLVVPTSGEATLLYRVHGDDAPNAAFGFVRPATGLIR